RVRQCWFIDDLRLRHRRSPSKATRSNSPAKIDPLILPSMAYSTHVLTLAVLAIVHSAHAAFNTPRRRRSLTSRIIGAVFGAVALLLVLLILLFCVRSRRRQRRAAANPMLVGPGGGGGMALGGGKPGLGFARPWGRNQNQNQGQNAMPMQQHQNPNPNPNPNHTQPQGAPAPPPYANGTANAQGEQGMHAQGGYAPPPGPPPPQQAHVNDKPGFVGGFKPT
ncbi:hypothetical protein B0H15DRAFT_540011, partial [Mycena belliarum]